MADQKPMTIGERVLILAALLLMIGCYEHSLIGISGGKNDAFYIVTSWALWMLSPCLAVYALLRIRRDKLNH